MVPIPGSPPRRRLGRAILDGLNRIARSRPIRHQILERSLVVFLYHEVSDRPSAFNRMFGLNVRPSVFTEQLDIIRARFHLIDPGQLLRGDYRTPAAIVTFDDGNASYFHDALPILRGKGVPSVMFANMGPVRGDVCWSGLATYLQHFETGFRPADGRRPSGDDFVRFSEAEVSRYLDSVDGAGVVERVRAFRGAIAGEREIESVAADPLVSLGSHLYNHYNATTLDPVRLREEYRKNQRVIDAHPRGLKIFSYPFSCFNDDTTRVLREEGAQGLFGGGGLPNVRGERTVYNRLELGEGAVTEEAVVSEILKNVVGAMARRVLRRNPPRS